MTPNRNSQRNNNRPIRPRDPPPNRYHPRRKHHHPRTHHNTRHERDPKPLDNLRHFEPKVGSFDFFFRGAPGDVVGEEVGEEGMGEVHGEVAEEEAAAHIVRIYYVLGLGEKKEG